MEYGRTKFLAILVFLLCACGAFGVGNKCPTYCTYLEYSPSCGMRADGTTYQFTNTCDYRTYECNHPGEFISISPGPCY